MTYDFETISVTDPLIRTCFPMRPIVTLMSGCISLKSIPVNTFSFGVVIVNYNLYIQVSQDIENTQGIAK